MSKTHFFTRLNVKCVLLSRLKIILRAYFSLFIWRHCHGVIGMLFVPYVLILLRFVFPVWPRAPGSHFYLRVLRPWMFIKFFSLATVCSKPLLYIDHGPWLWKLPAAICKIISFLCFLDFRPSIQYYSSASNPVLIKYRGLLYPRKCCRFLS